MICAGLSTTFGAWLHNRVIGALQGPSLFKPPVPSLFHVPLPSVRAIRDVHAYYRWAGATAGQCDGPPLSQFQYRNPVPAL
jgi:hypothetical protein